MHTAKLSDIRTNDSLFNYFASWRDVHPAWSYCAAGYTLLMVACLIAGAMDDRMLYGVSVWTKPFKFSMSIATYFATLVVFAQYAPRGFFATWSGKTMTSIPVVCALFEMIYITGQGALGEPSHFNVGTTYHAIMYSLMGLGATMMVLVLPWMAVVLARANSMAEPLMLAIVVGLVLTFILGGGFGAYMSNQGGHWVGGAASDAQGIALMKWARDGGDLRVAHFFGMHAMQALPLFAWLLPRKIPNRYALTLVVAFAAGYSAFSWATFNQAVQGQPFFG